MAFFRNVTTAGLAYCFIRTFTRMELFGSRWLQPLLLTSVAWGLVRLVSLIPELTA